MPTSTCALNLQLDHDFGGEDYEAPATYYLGLSTSVITASGSETSNEPSDTSYERVEITNDKTNWSVASSGSLSNAVAFSFPQSSQSWGTIRSAFLSSGSQAGAVNDKVWYYYTLSPSIPVIVNTVVTFDAGTITISRT